MKKLLIILQALIAFTVLNTAHADTVTGYVEAISGCNYKEEKLVNLIKLNDEWYRGKKSDTWDTTWNTSFTSVRLSLHDWWALAPIVALVSGRTLTLTYDPVFETLCGKSIVGRFDYGSAYGEVQIDMQSIY